MSLKRVIAGAISTTATVGGIYLTTLSDPFDNSGLSREFFAERERLVEEYRENMFPIMGISKEEYERRMTVYNTSNDNSNTGFLIGATGAVALMFTCMSYFADRRYGTQEE